MLIEVLVFFLIGTLAGTLTGLIPGIHINLVGAILVSLSLTILAPIPPVFLIVFISSMAITHTFIDFIPSILLGCPDTDTELSVLPGHELLKKGQGYAAIILSTYGSIAAIAILILISYPSLIAIQKIYPLIKNLIPYFLILVSLFLIFSEKSKIKAFLAFALSGILGTLVLNSSTTEPLLPLLTGLFGSSALFLAIKNKTKIPEQKITKTKTKILRPLLGAAVASPLCSFLPGLGSGQAAILGNTISRTNKKGFLVLLGATNTLVMGFSFLSLYTISRTRTGAAAAIKSLLNPLNIETLILILIIIIFSGIASFFLTKNLAKFFAKNISRISYSTISKITLAILFIIVLSISHIFGILILTISTATGIYCISLKVRRTNMMGALLIPTIIFYLT